MKKLFAMYRISIKTSLASAIAYRADFFMNFLIIFASNMLVPLATLLIYGAGASFIGWNMYEALLFQATFMLVTGICSPLFYGMVWITMGNVREGSYDLLLLKPCPAIVTSAAFSFSLENIGSLVGALTIFMVSVINLPLIPLLSWLSFAYFMICGVILVFGMVCLMSSMMFKWVGNSRIYEIFSASTGFARYPLTIFPRWLIVVITSVFPIAVLGVFPAYALLGKIEPVMYLILLPCILFALFGVIVFNKMIRTYQSAGG